MSSAAEDGHPFVVLHEALVHAAGDHRVLLDAADVERTVAEHDLGTGRPGLQRGARGGHRPEPRRGSLLAARPR